MSVEYVSRGLPGGITDEELYDAAWENNKAVLISGPTGAGKSMSVLSWAHKKGLPVAHVNFGFDMGPGELFGDWYPAPDGGFVWRDGAITALLREGEGVVFLDELNRAKPSVTANLHPLLDGRREVTLYRHNGEVVSPSGKVLVVAAINPEGDYVGALPLDPAIRRRFAYQVKWGYDESVESQLVRSKELLRLAQVLRSRFGTTLSTRTPVSTADLVELEEAAGILGADAAWGLFLARFSGDDADVVSEVLSLHTSTVEGEWTSSGVTGTRPPRKGAPQRRPAEKPTVEAGGATRHPSLEPAGEVPTSRGDEGGAGLLATGDRRPPEGAGGGKRRRGVLL